MIDFDTLTSAAARLLARTETSDWLLVLLSPVFFAAVIIEWLHFRRSSATAAASKNAVAKPIYDARDAMDSMTLGGVYTFIDVFLVLVLVLPAMNAVHAHRLATIEMSPWRFVWLYLGVEFCYYWFHRASHRIRWFWCAHVVHHASEHMNFTTAMRQSWLYTFDGNWLFYTPMVWLGFEPRWVLCALSINLAYQFFVHTQWVGKMPALIEYIFNTPSHHRVHHGRNPAYIDRNYGGTFILLDRLFGTFVAEGEKAEYGLVKQVHSHNPLWLTVHEWVAMARDIARPGPLLLRLKHLWAPPEWERPAWREAAGRHAAQPARDNRAHASESPSRPQHAARP